MRKKGVGPHYFTQTRPGVVGGEVTWDQMARHLDIRTLAFYSNTTFVLWGRLPLEDVVAVARYLGAHVNAGVA